MTIILVNMYNFNIKGASSGLSFVRIVSNGCASESNGATKCTVDYCLRISTK